MMMAARLMAYGGGDSRSWFAPSSVCQVASQARCKGIVYEAVRALGFERAAGGHHQGRIADMGDFAVG